MLYVFEVSAIIAFYVVLIWFVSRLLTMCRNRDE